jgi:hypothetical protein
MHGPKPAPERASLPRTSPLRNHANQKPKLPESGCLVGIHRSWYHLGTTARTLDLLETKLGQKPAVFVVFDGVSLQRPFPSRVHEVLAANGIVPFFFAKTYLDFPPPKKSEFLTMEGIVSGQYDREIAAFAGDARSSAEKYGGFFATTLWEMNIDARYAPYNWCHNPRVFKKAWSHIIDGIFEERKANPYITWCQEYHIDFPLTGYFAGDNVNLIGLSGHNRAPFRNVYGYRYLYDLISGSCKFFKREHPGLSVIVSETSSTKGNDQQKWTEKSLAQAKKYSDIHLINFWDNAYPDPSGWEDDHFFTDESYATMRKTFATDPYFIMAKKTATG